MKVKFNIPISVDIPDNQIEECIQLAVKNNSDCVQVVKCKECQFWVSCGYYGDCCRGYLGITSADDYCSRGCRKHKEGESNEKDQVLV